MSVWVVTTLDGAYVVRSEKAADALAGPNDIVRKATLVDDVEGFAEAIQQRVERSMPRDPTYTVRPQPRDPTIPDRRG